MFCVRRFQAKRRGSYLSMYFISSSYFSIKHRKRETNTHTKSIQNQFKVEHLSQKLYEAENLEILRIPDVQMKICILIEKRNLTKKSVFLFFLCYQSYFEAVSLYWISLYNISNIT